MTGAPVTEAPVTDAAATAGFDHRFEPASVPRRVPVLLLHKTGGTEDELLPLGRDVGSGSALLAVGPEVLATAPALVPVLLLGTVLAVLLLVWARREEMHR